LNAEDDKKKLALVQARNQGEATVHSVKKSLGEYGDKLEAGEKEKIEAAIKELEEAVKSDDTATIEAKNTSLMEVSQKLGEKMYADMQAQEAANAAGGAAGAAGAEQAGASNGKSAADDNVVDAEVKEVKDPKETAKG
jgi:molecular chaperone DnaK